MKKVIGLTVVLMVFFLAANVQAVDLKGKFALSGAGGLAMPMGDFNDFYKMGFGGGVEAEYFVLSQLSAGGNFTYNMFSLDDEFAEDSDDEKYKIMTFGAFGKYIFITEGKFLPYGKFGFNFNTPKFADETGDTKMGISIGGGGMYMASEMVGVGAEVMFHSIFTEGSSTQYLTFYGKISVFLGAK
ncbi:MAG: porin family protein [candidate division Zixibacteria bacterium]|nr:porin family protein [candidate division Zixibacteria bacterium]